jgi:hypothetical protein
MDLHARKKPEPDTKESVSLGLSFTSFLTCANDAHKINQQDFGFVYVPALPYLSQAQIVSPLLKFGKSSITTNPKLMCETSSQYFGSCPSFSQHRLENRSTC